MKKWGLRPGVLALGLCHWLYNIFWTGFMRRYIRSFSHQNTVAVKGDKSLTQITFKRRNLDRINKEILKSNIIWTVNSDSRNYGR